MRRRRWATNRHRYVGDEGEPNMWAGGLLEKAFGIEHNSKGMYTTIYGIKMKKRGERARKAIARQKATSQL